MDYFTLAIGGIWYVAFVVSTTLHEAAHGLAAKKLGDPTADHHGLVTLDPLPHIQRSPMGMVVIPIISFLLNGWMLGWASAPYDPYWAQDNRKKSALMALAGPSANLLLVVLAGIVIRAGMSAGFFNAPEAVTFTQVTVAASPGFANSVAIVISIFFSLNLILLVFNLIPVPPLDGSAIVMLLMSDSAAEKYQTFLSQPAFQIMGLVAAWELVDVIFPAAQILALAMLYPGHIYG